MSQIGVGCKDCKRVREHVAWLLPVGVREELSGKSLHIRAVGSYARFCLAKYQGYVAAFRSGLRRFCVGLWCWLALAFASMMRRLIAKQISDSN
jgi:hypothetical protein